MEDAFLQNADGVFHGRLEFRFLDFREQDYGMVVLGPFGVVLVEFWLYPVFACDDCLLAVAADDDGWCATEGLQRIVVCLNLLYFFR